MLKPVVLVAVLAGGVVAPAGAEEARGGGQLANFSLDDLVECEGGECEDAVPRWLAAVWIVQVVDNGTVPALGSVRRFSDVGDDHRYVAYIERAAELGITQGCGDGTRFCPDDTVSRGQMATFLVRAFDLPPALSSFNFDDIGSDHRFVSEIAAITAAGITVGCGDGSNYCDTATVTRSQLRVMLGRGQTTRSTVDARTDQREVTTTTLAAAQVPVPQADPIPQEDPVLMPVQVARDMLVHDWYRVNRVGLEAFEVVMDVLANDECVTTCSNVSIKYVPKVHREVDGVVRVVDFGVTRWDANMLVFSVAQGEVSPSWAVSIGYETDTSPWNAIVTIVINEIPYTGDALVSKTYDIDHLDNQSFSIDLDDVLQGAFCGAGCENVIVTDPPDVGTLSAYDSVNDSFAYSIADIDDVPAQVTFQYETNDSSSPATVTVNINVQKTYQKITVGSDFWCGFSDKVDSAGTIECQGNNDNGIIDDIPSGSDFEEISAGKDHACARRANNSVTCWGENDDGQANDPTESLNSIDLGGDYSCGALSSGPPKCWGASSNFIVGFESSSHSSGISVGSEVVCGIKGNKNLDCWGNNRSGLLAFPAGDFKNVAVGHRHACGIKSDNMLDCWGHSAGGATTEPSGQFKALSAGDAMTCGIRMNDTVHCWGATDGTVPAGAFESLSSTGKSTCALTVNGVRSCWGGFFDS